MPRQEEQVDRSPSTAGTPAATGGWRDHGRMAVLLGGLVVLPVAAVTFGILQFGLDTVLRLAGVLALLLIAGGAVAVGSLAVVLNRRLRELRHLPDLGRTYVTNHEDGLVTGLLRDGSGYVVLQVTSAARQTIVLDEDGAPDHVTSGGAAISQWRIPESLDTEPEVLQRIEALFVDKVPVRLVSEGIVALSGPAVSGWRLEADNGLILTSRA